MAVLPISVVKKIIRIRNHLIKQKKSFKNDLKCIMYIKELSQYIQAYEKKWSIESQQKFIQRNIDKIEYLIAENEAGKSLKKELYGAI